MDRINLLSDAYKGWTREVNNTISIPFSTKLANYICRHKKWSFTILTGTVTIISIIALRIRNNSKSSTPKHNPTPSSETVPPIVENSESTFISDVEAWKNDAPANENRNEAASRILTCMRNSETTLNLSHLSLSSLPGSISSLSSLTKLDLSYNRFISLPESISSLSSLTELNLSDNLLTSLPESISSLSSLTKLDLSYNQLISLPESISSLSSLTELKLSHNHLTTLPNSFGSLSSLTKLNLSFNRLTSLPESISSLSSLTELDLSDNLLTSLPESISSLSSLTELDLSYNRFTSLPESISSLSSLTKLNLSRNQLTSLPNSFGSLSSLRSLFLYRNQLTSLPNEILQLSNSCFVDLSNNSLSQVVLARLQTAINTPNYDGPTIHFSIQESPRDLRSTEIILTKLFQLAEIDSFEIPQSISENTNFNPWLNKLSYTADYKRGGKSQKAMVQLTLKYIQIAAEDEGFRETFLTILTQSNDTCGDRVAYYFIKLGIAYRLHTTPLDDPQALAKYLINTCWAIDELEKIAANKVLTLRFVDEIEVYLAYPIELREGLDMDLNTQEMLYFSSSAVSEQELESVAEFVLSCRNDEEAQMEYLTSHFKWIEVLNHHKKDEMRSLEALCSELEIAESVSKYQEGHLNLTKELLSNS